MSQATKDPHKKKHVKVREKKPDLRYALQGIVDSLIGKGLIDREAFDEAWTEAERAREPLEEFLIGRFNITKNDIGAFLSAFYKCRFVDFDETVPIPKDLLKNLKYEYLCRELWVPMGRENGVIMVVVDNPGNIIKRDTIESLLKTKSVEYCVALASDVKKIINHFFQIDESLLPQAPPEPEADSEQEAPPAVDPSVSESDSVIVGLVNRMINEAFDRRASDIHIEPDTIDQHVAVRFRIDGECIPYKIYPYDFKAAIVSRIKIMSNLDITERRLPQDGKIRFRRPNTEEIELRVATVPTHGYVEDVVLRILTRGKIMTLEELNMYPGTYEAVLKVLKNPYGLFLIVGPTGSGKTTTAHAALHVLNKPNTKIWTAEDPVEITQQGIRQVQVHHKIGFDFSHAMRAFLRSDPDIILVGEMRDYETAKMGVEASTTGHLVLSTLHTNNAPETIVRLLDMGIDPFAFADSLLCVLAQRLTRKLCPNCKEPYHPSRAEFDEIVRSYGEKLFAETKIVYGNDLTLYRARGCHDCTQTGFRGMMGIFELLVVTENIKQMIINKKSIPAIRRTATVEGMRTLLQDGISKVLAGETELVEVLSVCMR